MLRDRSRGPGRGPSRPLQPSVRPPQRPRDQDQDAGGIRARHDDQVPARPAVMLDGRHGAAVEPQPGGGDERRRPATVSPASTDERLPPEPDQAPAGQGRRTITIGRPAIVASANSSRGYGGSGSTCAGIRGSKRHGTTQSGTAAATGSTIRTRRVQGRRRAASRSMAIGRTTLTSARPIRVKTHPRRDDAADRPGPGERPGPARVVGDEAGRHAGAGGRSVVARFRRGARPAGRRWGRTVPETTGASARHRPDRAGSAPPRADLVGPAHPAGRSVQARHRRRDATSITIFGRTGLDDGRGGPARQLSAGRDQISFRSRPQADIRLSYHTISSSRPSPSRSIMMSPTGGKYSVGTGSGGMTRRARSLPCGSRSTMWFSRRRVAVGDADRVLPLAVEIDRVDPSEDPAIALADPAAPGPADGPVAAVERVHQQLVAVRRAGDSVM